MFQSSNTFISIDLFSHFLLLLLGYNNRSSAIDNKFNRKITTAHKVCFAAYTYMYVICAKAFFFCLNRINRTMID